MFFNNLLPQTFVDFMSPNGLEFGNIFNLLLTCNFGYVIYIISFIKFELIDFFINMLSFIFFDNILNYDYSNFNINQIFKKYGYEDLTFFYCLKMTEINISFKL
jgi:hypothetical protein